MSRPAVVVLDYGSGNVHSAVKALAAAGADVRLSADRSLIQDADGLVVPGVGSFRAVMAALRGTRGDDTEGLGQWPGEVTRLDAEILPHIGWNTVQAPAGSRLFRGLEAERFYFVHSFAASRWELPHRPPFPPSHLTWTTYGRPFLAAVESGPLSGTQFHPEKSGPAGIRLLANWLTTLAPQ